MIPLTFSNAIKLKMKNQKDRKIKIPQSDRGSEYFPNNFSMFCEEHSIIHQSLAPYTLQQNGLVERKNRTLVNIVNVMILSAELPFNSWGEALLTACYVHNKVSSKKIKVSSYELWNRKKPNVDYIKVGVFSLL